MRYFILAIIAANVMYALGWLSFAPGHMILPIFSSIAAMILQICGLVSLAAVAFVGFYLWVKTPKRD